MAPRKTRATKSFRPAQRRTSSKSKGVAVLQAKASAKVTKARPKSTKRETPKTSLCFREAVLKFKANEITQDEYLQAIVAHCSGNRHGENQQCNGDSTASKARDGSTRKFASDLTEQDDPFAYTMMKWIHFHVCQRRKQVQDTEPIFNVLKAYLSSNVPSFRKALAAMTQAYPLKPREKLQASLRGTFATSLLKVMVYDTKQHVPMLQAMLSDADWRGAFFDNKEYDKTYTWLWQHRAQKQATLDVLDKEIQANKWDPINFW